jgi:hypothetical protein
MENIKIYNKELALQLNKDFLIVDVEQNKKDMTGRHPNVYLFEYNPELEQISNTLIESFKRKPVYLTSTDKQYIYDAIMAFDMEDKAKEIILKRINYTPMDKGIDIECQVCDCDNK